MVRLHSILAPQSKRNNPKVVEIRRPRKHQDCAAGPAQKRRMTAQTIVLECAALRRRDGTRASSQRGYGDELSGKGESIGTDSERETVLFHLWDEQICLASLFRKGDGLAIYWPWLVQGEGNDPPGASLGLPQQSLAFTSQASLEHSKHTAGKLYLHDCVVGVKCCCMCPSLFSNSPDSGRI